MPLDVFRRSCFTAVHWVVTAGSIALLALVLSFAAGRSVFAQTSAPSLTTYRPYVYLQGEGYVQSSGVVVGAQDISDLDTGDWVRYSGISFGTAGAKGFMVQLGVPASNAGGVIEVRLDSPTAPPVARLQTVSTGGYTTYAYQAIDVPTAVTGVHEVYLTFVGNDVASLNSFGFTSTTPSPMNPPATVPVGPGGYTDPSQTTATTTPTAPPTTAPPTTGGPLPTLTLTASPSTVDPDGRTTISWTATNATYCYSSMTGQTGASGTWLSPPLTVDRVYSFTCWGPGGSVGKSVTVLVNYPTAPPPPPPSGGGGGGGGTTTPPPGTSTNRDAYKWIEAESRNSQTGTTITGGSVTALSSGDTLCYTGVQFGSTGALGFVARYARAGSVTQSLVIHLGSPTGTVIGKLVVPLTGGDSVYAYQGTTLTQKVIGSQTICFSVEGGADGGAFDKFVFLHDALQCPSTAPLPMPAS